MKSLLIFSLLKVIFCLNDKLKYGDNDRIDVDLSYIDSQLIDIVWCGEDKTSDDNVLVLSSKGSVYRSHDKGGAWNKLAEVFLRKGLVQLDNEDMKVGVVNKIQRSPVDPQLMIFLGTESVNWISPDCGSTINAIGTNGQMREFQFHPGHKDWILASSWSKCPPKTSSKSNQKSKKECFVTKDLMLTQDMGVTWKQIATNINQFAWGAKNQKMLEIIPENRILLSHDPNTKANQRIGGWSMKTHLFYSDDFFKSSIMIVNQGNKFLLAANFIFVAQVMKAQSQEVTLMVADPNEKSYNFKYVELPETLKEHSYTILDTSEGSVFININHLKPSAPMGSIYISDSTGTRFSLSLSNNVRTEEGQCDFEKVLGLEGIYIANVYQTEQAELYQAQYEEDNEITVENTSGSSSGQKSFKENELQRFKQTKITFDKGGIWQSVQAPDKDSDGKKIKCENKVCNLHLHSVSTHLQFGPFYSTATSIGVVIGTGNTGKYLSYRSDQINTYLSRDGGLNWYEIAKGSHIYEIGDHGGLIVLANDQQATQELKYSWNEGLDWWFFQFSDTPVEITNIITEPSNTATRFILYGTANIESNGEPIEQGVIITIDFSNLHTRECEGVDKAGSLESDYEEWTPNGKINPDCLMGKKVVIIQKQQVTYIRRKRDSQCFNSENMENVKFIENCKCTEEDWECDLGFHRENSSGPCVSEMFPEIDYAAPEVCEDFYYVTQGYRKVAGDLCLDGFEHNPIKLPCPGFRFFQINSIWDLVLIIIFGGILFFVYNNRDMCLKRSESDSQQLPMTNNDSRKDYAMAGVKQNQSSHEGLGYREFDEELLEQDDTEKTITTAQIFHKKQINPTQEIL